MGSKVNVTPRFKYPMMKASKSVLLVSNGTVYVHYTLSLKKITLLWLAITLTYINRF